ncbi:Hypothetical protein NTJ_04491 [Nesidiocoris tenuis]|uniref:Uncharacterized protein n=1 Tax=Nesidiocoris tenuis TaxID=355587 RepID=A0ABN7AI04_9HEMI|nr:Hypothetical protein NTJ_04491 [Nesidiocoris tenuis]
MLKVTFVLLVQGDRRAGVRFGGSKNAAAKAALSSGGGRRNLNFTAALRPVNGNSRRLCIRGFAIYPAETGQPGP